MSNFTKGPWKIINGDLKNRKFVQIVGPVYCANEISNKDLNLISAAPDMRNDLELLRDHLAFLKGDDYELVIQADKTLAKADGKGK